MVILKVDTTLLDQTITRLHEIPRLNWGFYATPVEELPRLRKALGIDSPRLFIKRDDYTGAGFGGNKVRKLEYVMAKAVADGAEVVITVGGEKSNHARVTAAMAARLGLRCVLVLSPAAINYEGLEPASVRVDELLGAEIHHVLNRDERAPTMKAIAAQLRNQEKQVVEIPLGASVPLGALGFVRAAREAKFQLAEMDVKMSHIFHASSSGGTQAGLVAGAQLFGLDETKIIGVSPDDPSEDIAAEVERIIGGINDLLELPEGTLTKDVTVLDDYVGEGYGIPSIESDAALSLLASSEGVLLDPVYTAKAMAGLIDWVRQGRLTADDTVLFWHTGGQLALFYAPQSAG